MSRDRAKLIALLDAWTAEAAEEDRLATLPNTCRDTAMFLTTRAQGRKDCVSDLRALLDAEPRPIATLGTPGPFPPGAMKPEWEGDPAHIQTVSATTKQIDAFNMNPGKEWVIYFTEPTTGACAQTFARLDNYLVRAEPRPTEEPAPAPRRIVCCGVDMDLGTYSIHQAAVHGAPPPRPEDRRR